MDIESIIPGSDPKKIWSTHSMMVNGILCAISEFMVLHYATRESRTIGMAELVQAALKQVLVPIAPDWAGRHINLDRS